MPQAYEVFIVRGWEIRCSRSAGLRPKRLRSGAAALSGSRRPQTSGEMRAAYSPCPGHGWLHSYVRFRHRPVSISFTDSHDERVSSIYRTMPLSLCLCRAGPLPSPWGSAGARAYCPLISSHRETCRVGGSKNSSPRHTRNESPQRFCSPAQTSLCCG